MTQEFRYGSKTEALTYFADFNIKANQDMSDLQDNEFNMYLLKATQLVDFYNYKGVKSNKDQPLRFPRVFENGGDDITPDYIKFATFETAHSLYKVYTKGKDELNSISATKDKVKSKALDTMRIEYFESNANDKSPTEFIPLIAKQYLSKYILKNVSKPIKNYQVPVIRI